MKRETPVPRLIDSDDWEERYHALFVAVTDPLLTPEERQQGIDRAAHDCRVVEYIQKELMRRYPAYDRRSEKPPEVLGKCYWWNGISQFSIENWGKTQVRITVMSYVGGGESDSRELTIDLPEDLHYTLDR